MTIIKQDDLIESVAAALQYISYYHPADFIQHLARAYESEQSPAAKDALEQILTNSRMCAEGKRPICQDTGIVNVFLKIGMGVRFEGFTGSLDDAINEGVRRAYLHPDNKLRASVLDVLNQDYIRPARSKGVSERKVITRHAFRNSLIPLATIVAFDFAALIGGAVITETVFGWSGMGAMFREGLAAVDPPPVMAFYLVTGSAAVLMNLVADIAYAFLDPRIAR